MDFVTSIKTCLKEKYLTKAGRASRSEYWYFYLFFCIVWTGCAAIGAGTSEGIQNALLIIAGIGLGIPSFTAMSRRFHDMDKSAWFILLGLIPVVGPIILIVMLCRKGTDGPNRFGNPPVA